jgi:3',5'-cyclic AMP phosphodiesterase CpdA
VTTVTPMTHDLNKRFSLAVIADAHFHDIEGDYAVPGIVRGERCLSLQTWAASRQSTRVFNESAAALDRALATIAADDIRHVILLGDYTDDGQRQTTENLARRLADHESRFGTRFYALPGNHDLFGPFGRHQSRHFLQADGPPVLVTSDHRDPPADCVVTPKMYCEGYPAGLAPMARHGYFRRPEDLLWETPFGPDDALEARTYAVMSEDGQNHYRLIDASYLIEPEEGLWLLMIDANVFEPRNGQFKQGSKRAFVDSTGAGWNAMLRLKPFILDWMGDVSARARRLGKTLLTFSHYPASNPFGKAGDLYERRLFPQGVIAARMPENLVAETLLEAGISLHFSGHWHAHGASHHSHAGAQFTNIAVPSLVAFPPAFDILSICGGALAVKPVDLWSMPLDADLMELYRQECETSGLTIDAALWAETYGAFLYRHMRALVVHRFFPQEWPETIVSVIASMTISALLQDPRTAPRSGSGTEDFKALATSDDGLERLSVIDLVTDWYCLRQGGSLCLTYLGDEKVARLKALAGLYRDNLAGEDDRVVAAYLASFFQSLDHYLDRAAAEDLHCRSPDLPKSSKT